MGVGWRRFRDLGGPPVEEPVQRGFGFTVLTTLAETTVSGKVTLDYDPSGVRWELTCPACDALEPVGTVVAAEAS